MGQSCLLIFLNILSIILVQGSTFKQNFENQEVIRNIDLRGQLEVQTVKYSVQNIGDEAASSYIVSFLPLERGKRGVIQGYSDTEMSKELPTKEVKGTLEGNIPVPKGTRFFQIDLPEPIEPDETGDFHVVVVIIHGLKPFPAEILQNEAQFVLYAGDAYEYSIYKTVNVRTIAILASKNVEFYTKTKAHAEEDRVHYGPFTDIEPLSSSPIKIHFENNAPFAVFKSAVKEVEISHWGNVAVEESYLLQHNGAKLKGGFSRYNYQHTDQQQERPSFRGLIAQLHPDATDIYYRDEIGNISTSHARYTEDFVNVEVQPRFPMFGGWKIDFKMGYNLPASSVLSYKKSSSSTYVLNVTFGAPFPLTVTDDYEVHVIFPEGASNIKWSTGIDIDSEDKDVRVTYLDTTGRPVLILRKAGIVGVPRKYFQVTYSFSQMSMFKEPILLITAFVAFFLICIVYVRIDLSITSEKKIRGTNQEVNKFLDMTDRMVVYYKAGDVSAGDAQMKECNLKLGEISKQTSPTSKKRVEDFFTALKQNKKVITPARMERYQQLCKQLARY